VLTDGLTEVDQTEPPLTPQQRLSLSLALSHAPKAFDRTRSESERAERCAELFNMICGFAN
jgi:hypothetical protein